MLIAMLATMAGGATLQPSTKWVVEFADSACQMARGYGSGRDRVDLHFRAPILGNKYEIMIAVPESARNKSLGSHDGWIERLDGSKAVSFSAYSYSTDDQKRLTRFDVDPDQYTLGEDGDRISFHLAKKRRYDFAIPDFKKAQSVLGQCLTGLRKEFAVDESVTDQIATEAVLTTPIYRFFNTKDYPTGALREGEQGYVGTLLWIESDGLVKDCRIVETSFRKALDERTCQVIRDRARFSPALDHQGRPIRSPYSQRIKWEIAQ